MATIRQCLCVWSTLRQATVPRIRQGDFWQWSTWFLFAWWFKCFSHCTTIDAARMSMAMLQKFRRVKVVFEATYRRTVRIHAGRSGRKAQEGFCWLIQVVLSNFYSPCWCRTQKVTCDEASAFVCRWPLFKSFGAWRSTRKRPIGESLRSSIGCFSAQIQSTWSYFPTMCSAWAEFWLQSCRCSAHRCATNYVFHILLLYTSTWTTFADLVH